jgi:hypothetical protein
MVPMPSIGDAARARRPRSAAIGRDPAAQAFGLREHPAEVVGRQPRDKLAFRTVAASLRPISASARSPARRPCSAFDLLEVVDVDQNEREHTLVARGPPCLGPKLVVESAVVGQVRQPVAGGERAELGAGIGEADGRLSCDGEGREAVTVRARGDDCAPEPSADTDRRGTSRSLSGAEDHRRRPVRLERHGAAGDASDRALRLVGTDDRPEAARLEAHNRSGVDADRARPLPRRARRARRDLARVRLHLGSAALPSSCFGLSRCGERPVRVWSRAPPRTLRVGAGAARRRRAGSSMHELQVRGLRNWRHAGFGPLAAPLGSSRAG